MTDCDVQWTLDFRASSQNLKEYSLKTSAVSFGIQMVDKLYIKYRHEQWGMVKPTTDCDAHLPLDVKIVLQKIQNHYYDTNHDDTLCTKMCVAYDSLLNKRCFRQEWANH